MPDIYRELIDAFEKRKIAYTREFIPFFISSVATHMFNLTNKNKPVYTEGGGAVVDTRQHVLFVAPPGWGKTYLLRQFLESEVYSILKKTTIQSQFMTGKVTEAGFIGTIKEDQKSGQVKKIYGYAHKHSNAILGCEEFSAVTRSFIQEYNVGLDTAILTALDTGLVGKTLGAGTLEYTTNLTLWAGTQPARYDLGSGFARRFIFLVFNPTWNDEMEFRRRRRESKNLQTNQVQLKMLRDMMDQRMTEIKNVTGIQFTTDFYKEMDKLNVMHYEEALYERLAIGYWMMKNNKLYGTVQIYIDEELKRIIELEKQHRKKAKRGTQQYHVEAILKEKGKVDSDEVYDLLADFGIDPNTAKACLNGLMTSGKIKRDGSNLLPVAR